jgi:hypothetical protein
MSVPRILLSKFKVSAASRFAPVAALLLSTMYTPAQAAPIRSVCSQIGVVSPQFASFNAGIGDRDLGRELRDLVEQPTSMDPL